MINVKETIVVEGKDDRSAVLAAVEANVLCTNGYGMNASILENIRFAYEGPGIIIFTDPDHAGRKIREKLSSLFPNAKHAYLTQTEAKKEDDIGIENASPEHIIKALEKAHAESADALCKSGFAISNDDLVRLGLAGRNESAALREKVGAELGIGYANTKTFLKRLYYMGVTLDSLEKACKGFCRK